VDQDSVHELVVWNHLIAEVILSRYNLSLGGVNLVWVNIFGVLFTSMIYVKILEYNLSFVLRYTYMLLSQRLFYGDMCGSQPE